MEEDVTKIYEEYLEELLFCKYFIAEKLKHHAEMGRCGENILKKCLQERLPEEKTLDYFVCLHRESLNSSARDKQVFFLKDGQDRQFYVLDNHFPIMQNFSRLIQSLQN